MPLIMWIALVFLAVGLSMILRRRAGASDYVRRNPRTPATEEQIRQIYLVLGVLVCVGALLALAVIVLSG